jgi:hypothetical protein
MKYPHRPISNNDSGKIFTLQDYGFFRRGFPQNKRQKMGFLGKEGASTRRQA